MIVLHGPRWERCQPISNRLIKRAWFDSSCAAIRTAHGAPRAQQPLHDPANITGVATGSRKGSASESVTLRSRGLFRVLNKSKNSSASLK